MFQWGMFWCSSPKILWGLFRGTVLSDEVCRYYVTDKKLLSVYYAVKKCEFYVIGNNFIVYTDHKKLIYRKIISDTGI